MERRRTNGYAPGCTFRHGSLSDEDCAVTQAFSRNGPFAELPAIEAVVYIGTALMLGLLACWLWVHDASKGSGRK